MAKSDKKFTLTVIYGREATRYANECGVKKAKKEIWENRLDGSFAEYEMDSQKDLDVLKQALMDHDGWDGYYYED